MSISIGFGVVSACALLAAAYNGYEATQDGPPVIITSSPQAAEAAAPGINGETAEYRIDGEQLTIVKDGEAHGWVKLNPEPAPDDQAFSVYLPLKTSTAKVAGYSAKKALKTPYASRPPVTSYAHSASATTTRDFNSSMRTRTRFDKLAFTKPNWLQSFAKQRSELHQFLDNRGSAF